MSRGRLAPRRSTARKAASGSQRRIAARAHAKVNLDLRVLGTRPDGYHELRTVFQSIELHDTITAQQKAGPFVLKCRTPGVPLDDRNLVWRAAAALWKALGRAGDPADTVVTIDKAIPMQAGLGGGSADAAAALQVLGRLWGGAPLSLLREVAAGVGSDAPFFLSGGTALGLGRGEEVYPLVDLPRHWIVLVRPPFGVSTVEAYSWYDEDRAAGVREPRIDVQILPVPWPSRAAQMINDLEAPVIRRHPEIGTHQGRAAAKPAPSAAAMSGSGSVVFGLFRTRPAAARALRPLAKLGESVVLSHTLSRGEHEARARPILRRV